VDVGVAVFFREAEAFAQILADVVSIEDFDPVSALDEHFGHANRKGRLARARQAGEPQRESAARAHAVNNRFARKKCDV
jgi:hypothetical protein